MNWADELIREYPSLEGAREKLASMEARGSAMEIKIAQLQEENEKLRRDLAVLETRVKECSTQPGFVDASGVLWKSKSGGGTESVPYCPTCKSPLSDVSGSLLCLKCNWQAPLKSFEVPKVHHDLFGEK